MNLPGLKVLTLNIMSHLFSELEHLGKHVWEHGLDEKDFESVHEYGLITKLRGLSDFHLERYCHPFADTEAKKQMWKSNVEKYRRHIKAIITRPKNSSEQETGDNAAPLYLGSRVVYNDSTLLPDLGNRNPVDDYRLRDGEYKKWQSPPTTPDEVAAHLGKTGAELWEYIDWLERCSDEAYKYMIRKDRSARVDTS